MTGWSQHTGLAVSLPLGNVDTDQLIPARFMATPRSEGYGDFLLHDMRRDASGDPLPDFPLNANPDADILIAGQNFGCGSSREAAVYALKDAGFRAVIAPSFADIFAANAVNNGVLPARITAPEAAELARVCRSGRVALTVDLKTRSLTYGDTVFKFRLEDTWQQKLINGWDDIDLTRTHAEAIARFQQERREQNGWAWPARAI